MEERPEGNPKGRAPVEKERAYYDKTIMSVSLADWGEVVRKAVYQAKRGDRYARRWLGDYLIGPAIQRLELEHRMSNNRLVEWINELFGEADAQGRRGVRNKGRLSAWGYATRPVRKRLLRRDARLLSSWAPNEAARVRSRRRRSWRDYRGVRSRRGERVT